MIATTIGILPLIGLIAYLGEDMNKMKNGLYWISGIGLVVFGIYILYRKNPAVRKKIKSKRKLLKTLGNRCTFM
jgi:uncharacterized membrane protein YdjX (TVP38/TMEM64 family)